MSKISYDDAMRTVASTPTQYSSNGTRDDSHRVGFFKLENDGDEAVVRIMCDSVEDFEIVNVHRITPAGSKYPRTISCVRSLNEPVEKCPLCRENISPLSQKIYVRMIQYTKDPETNSIVAEAKIWERPVSVKINFATKLKDLLDNYGPLSDVICKIIRHGVKGTKETSYEIVPNLSKMIYRDDLYVKDESLFANYTAIGHACMNKSAEDLEYFLANNGEFPQKQYNNQGNNTGAPTAYTPKNVAPAPATAPARPAFNQQAPNWNANAPATQKNATQSPVTPKTTVTPPPAPQAPVKTNSAPWETVVEDNDLPF